MSAIIVITIEMIAIIVISDSHSINNHSNDYYHRIAFWSLQVVRVADSNGLKLPREFALLVKQASSVGSLRSTSKARRPYSIRTII